MFLRVLQYEDRLPVVKGSAIEKGTMAAMLTMKYNAYRDFANGLCYVLVSTPHQAGTTLYTEKALAKAKKMLAKYQLTENALIAESDNTLAVYDSASALLAFSPKTQEQKTDESFACAFTGCNEAEHAREELLRGGINYDKLVMMYDELYSHAVQQGGIIVDWFEYNFIISKKSFKMWNSGKNLMLPL